MGGLLDGINSPADLKKLNKEQITVLSQEIRGFLIDNVSKTGGHLSSNLGVVELTIALHRVFDTPKDKIVWDVGHQSYVHKILTGRRDKFHKLRKFGGISGFPKTEESEHDAFNAGHSSTSISAALGIAKGIILNNDVGNVAAVIGDGALTGGMAYEALNHAGSSRIPVIIILNDNGMSISQNVGGVARYLNRIRNNPLYFNLKDDIKGLLDVAPVIGKPINRFIHGIKVVLKDIFVQGKMFEDLGLIYLGPVDGHDVDGLTEVLKRAKKLREPVLVHVITQKGRGYQYAEQSPDVFHGIGKFDMETGEIITDENGAKSYSDIFGEALCHAAENNNKIAAITAAMPMGTGLEHFSKKYPKRFFDVGIAEQHAVTFAAGMAKEGIIPVFAVYSSFLQRAYDQILHDVALQNLHVVFAVDRAGCVGSDGETHQGIYDLSYLSHIPNMTVMAPADAKELSAMLDYAVNKIQGPVAIRYPRGKALIRSGEVEILNECGKLEIPYANGREDGDVLIISLGTILDEAVRASKILTEKGITCAVINARFAKPVDKALIKKYAKNCKIIATLEDNVLTGGFGSIVENVLGRNIFKFGFPDKPIEQGTVEEIRCIYNIDARSIAMTIEKEHGGCNGK